MVSVLARRLRAICALRQKRAVRAATDRIDARDGIPVERPVDVRKPIVTVVSPRCAQAVKIDREDDVGSGLLAIEGVGHVDQVIHAMSQVDEALDRQRVWAHGGIVGLSIQIRDEDQVIGNRFTQS